MASDFTVIQAVRQRFGDSVRDFNEVETEQEAPFVGTAKDYEFSCANVDPGQMAVLQFESLGVTAGFPGTPRSVVQVNGIDIAGGITAGPFTKDDRPKPIWKSHNLLIDRGVLKEQNVLHIQSAEFWQGHDKTFDNFIIDNVVVFFKLKGGIGPVFEG